MEVYEVVVKAMVTNTFRVIAQNQQEAIERADLMFSNDNLAEVLSLEYDIHRNQELAR